MTALSERIRAERQQAVDWELEHGFALWEVSRHLVSDWWGNGYVDVLPEFEGLNLIECIENRLARMHNPSAPLRLLDLGCGSGLSLVGAKGRWGNRIECSGITLEPYRRRDWLLQWIIKRQEVKIVVGDVHELYKYFPANHCDVVTAVYLFPYVYNHWWVLKQAYQVLKPDGIGLFNDFPYYAVEGDKEALMSYLESEYGILFSEMSGGVCFQKKNDRPKLRLPLRYTWKEMDDGNWPPVMVVDFGVLDLAQEEQDRVLLPVAG